MTLAEALAVLAAGCLAGGVNAIVGSGSLITFPVLLATGFAPVTANVANSIGLVFGNLSAAYGYRRELRGQARRCLVGGTGTMLGALAGGALLLTLPEDVFEAVVPLLILLSCALMVMRPAPSASSASHGSLGRHRELALIVIAFAVGIYGGYFGAAQGVILLAALRMLIPDHLQRLNGLKNVLVAIANGVAALLFIAVTHVAWGAVALIAVGSIGGAQIGARYGRRIPQETLRWAVVGTGVVVAAVLVVT